MQAGSGVISDPAQHIGEPGPTNWLRLEACLVLLAHKRRQKSRIVAARIP